MLSFNKFYSITTQQQQQQQQQQFSLPYCHAFPIVFLPLLSAFAFMFPFHEFYSIIPRQEQEQQQQQHHLCCPLMDFIQ